MAWWPIMNRWWLRASGLWRQAAMVIAAVRHPRTPFVAKLLFVLALLYAADPFDLIPDLIPGLGWLDDLLIVPLLFSAAWRFVPQEVANDLRTRGRTAGRGVRRAGLASRCGGRRGRHDCAVRRHRAARAFQSG